MLHTHGTAIDNSRPNSKPNCFHGRPFCPRQKSRNGMHGRIAAILGDTCVHYTPPRGWSGPGQATPAVLVARYEVVVSGLRVRARNGTICLLRKTNTAGAKDGQKRE